MSKELIVSTGKHETRVAILEDDQLVEIFHEREKEYSLAGSIHKGRVTRVLPGMQSAFVDIGLERDAFLYVSDFFEDNEEYEAVVSTVEEKVLKMEKGGGPPEPPRERSEPVRQALPAESLPSEVITARISETVAAPPLVERSPDRQQERPSERRDEAGREARPGQNGPDRGGDRGRGRRGRRRRGARTGPGGLPESKYFSPGADGESQAEEEVETPREVAAAPVLARESDDDFMVLPGESLAKYAVADIREEEELSDEDGLETEEEDRAEPEPSAAPASVETAAPAAHVPAAEATPAANSEAKPEAEDVEPAIPAEHPLAGLGDTQTWSTPAHPHEAVAVEAMLVVEQEETTAEDLEDPGFDAEGEADEAEELDVAEPDAEAGEESELPTAGEGAEDEGPEPARIPTSLTATLREQGHRYPHRVSRRMRRKMRGQHDDRDKPGAVPGDQKPAENRSSSDRTPAESRTVDTREDRRPEQRQETRQESRPEQRPERQDRGGRDRERSDRERPEREKSERERPEREKTERERPVLPSISDLLKEGQEIIVQIAKEPLGQKGARITSHIALPGRFVVYMPTVDHAGVSRKIPSDEERQRLKRIVQTHRQGIPGGFICRTAAENKSEEELKSDMHFLYNLWLDMRHKAEKRPAPVLLHHDLDLVQRILRDQLTASFKTIWVDGEELYESILRFAQRFQPALVARVKLYTRSNPIFDEFGITAELEKALRPKVWLKSGGYIVINQTEALVAIDINTGKYVGKSNRLEDTIVKINTDAIKEIVRQIRLRDLGGIIVVDFIDMDERKNRQKVMQVLEETMRADRAPYKILQFNDFGLVAITRKRVKQSLERTLCAPCPYCEGAGYVKSVQTVIGEILQEAQRMRKALEDQNNNIVLRVNPEVGRVLKSNQNQFLQELEEILGRSVLVKSDPLLHQTKFDLA